MKEVVALSRYTPVRTFLRIRAHRGWCSAVVAAAATAANIGTTTRPTDDVGRTYRQCQRLAAVLADTRTQTETTLISGSPPAHLAQSGPYCHHATR